MLAPLLDDGAGQIERAAIAVSTFSAQNFPDAIRNVLRALPRGMRSEVITDAVVAHDVRGWLDEAGLGFARLRIAPADWNYSLWMQDPLIVRVDGSASVSEAFDRYRDRDIALFLRKRAGWRAGEAPVHVDGGNVLVHGALTLVSVDVEADDDALTAFDPMRRVVRVGTAARCLQQTTRETDRPAPGWTETLNYLSTEGTRQPIFHLDHMIAPAGVDGDRPRFLVGCPRLGAEVIEHPLQDHSQPGAFDEIAKLLEASGAAVLRNPLPQGWVDRPERKFRRWFHLPVNNVLIHGDRVLLPSFANEYWPELEALDAANADLWQGLGFDTIPIPGMMALAEAMGGPRCMVKVTARG